MSHITTFFSAWTTTDADQRASLVRDAVAENIVYADPRTEGALKGPDAVTDYIGMFSQAVPGAAADVVKTDTTQGQSRVTVLFTMPNGMEQLGQYFVTPADGPITAITGFVGTGAPE